MLCPATEVEPPTQHPRKRIDALRMPVPLDITQRNGEPKCASGHPFWWSHWNPSLRIGNFNNLCSGVVKGELNFHVGMGVIQRYQDWGFAGLFHCRVAGGVLEGEGFRREGSGMRSLPACGEMERATAATASLAVAKAA